MAVKRVGLQKEFRDAIHGFIPVYKEELEIIDHPIFQRLRGIKQLSFAYMVYHGAEHSRFGHVLGTMHVVDRALNSLKKNSETYGFALDITEDDIKLARLAALLHDVGHLPFSHALDQTIPDNHEQYSASIVHNVFAHNIEKTGIETNDVIDLILGKPPLDKPFLRSLINSQLDVDKFDYLLRDSLYAGVKYGIFDLDRLIDSLLVVDGELVVLQGGFYTAEQLILARYHMFEQLYYHHTKRAFENMAKRVAKHLFDTSKTNYPSAQELRESSESELRKFTDYNDAWFLREVLKSGDKYIHEIAESIHNRLPFKVIVDSSSIKKEDPSAGRGFVHAIEMDIKNNYRNLGILETDILYDQFSNMPYSVKPYYTALRESPEGPDVVSIYNKKTDSARPIEEISLIVETLAKHNFSTHKIYVAGRKYLELYDFLKEKYKGFF